MAEMPPLTRDYQALKPAVARIASLASQCSDWPAGALLPDLLTHIWDESRELQRWILRFHDLYPTSRYGHLFEFLYFGLSLLMFRHVDTISNTTTDWYFDRAISLYDRLRLHDTVPGTVPAQAISSSTDFSFIIDPGDASVDDIRAVLAALNRLHIACGGLGFEYSIGGDHIQIAVGALA